MEYQKKARRGQLCILIYVLLIFVCSFVGNAVSLSSLPSPSSPASAVTFSASNPTLQSPKRSSSPAPKLSPTTSEADQSKQQQQSQEQPPTSRLSFPISQQQFSVFPVPASNLFPRSLLVAPTTQTDNTSTPSTSSSAPATSPSATQPEPLQRQPSHQALTRQTISEAVSKSTQTNQSTPLSSSLQSSLSSSSSSATTTTASSAFASRTNITTKICGGIHIRNDLKSFQQLEGCQIINGPLTIALVSNINNPKDYDNITFPLLTEVSDYLLFFRVQNLTTLSKLFPNLRVIRGRNLVSNYALIIYEMMHLQRIDLPNLNDILTGSVLIQKNPNLCYASTVNWDGICKLKYTPHYIDENKERCKNRCPDMCNPWKTPKVEKGLDKENKDAIKEIKIDGGVKQLGAENNKSLFCWNSQDCHEACNDGDKENLIKAPGGGCCSSLCAGGCYERDRSDQCISCRNVSQHNICVSRCDPNLYDFEGQCIGRDQCEQIEKIVNTEQCSKNEMKAFKAVQTAAGYRLCTGYCLAGFEEDPTNKHRCKPCDKGKCRKVCTPQDQSKPYMVTNVESLKQFDQCTIINGSLEISIKGGKNVLNELESKFENLEEISGYLKITRSYPLLTLDFLRSLRFINGSSLDRGQYSLVIIDNPNLQELFLFDKKEDSSKNLTIGGKIFVHLNPKLCPHKIDSLKQYAIVADWDEQDVSIHNNGDKEACNTEKLKIELVKSAAHYAVISFQNFAAKLDDPRSLLFYLINYREAPHENVTMFDGRDGCNSQNDVWKTIEEIPAKTSLNSTVDDYQKAVIKVEPAKRYALYVKTLTISAGSTGALSDMMYFSTAPDTPGIPRNLDSEYISSDTVTLSWMPPSKPNGIILYYTVTIKNTPEYEELQTLDICGSIPNRDTATKKISQNEPIQSSLDPEKSRQINGNSSDVSSETTQTTACAKVNPVADAETKQNVNAFQDTVIEVVYLKSTCSLPNSNKPVKEKKKRSIDSDPPDPDGISENSLPRKTIDPTHSSTVAPKNINQRSRAGSPTTIHHNRSSYKTEVKIPVLMQNEYESDLYMNRKNRITITGLEHYKLYEIEVVACHGDFVGDKTRPPSSYSRCGLYAVKQVKTSAIPENDIVNASTIMFYPANETNGNTITWEKPTQPNGLNLAFRVRYQLKNSVIDVWNEVCINVTAYDRDHGLTLSNISPGSYVLRIQTISMYPPGSQWSDMIEFEIPQIDTIPMAVWLPSIIIVVFLVAGAAALGAYHSRKKGTHADLIYASVNPDYVQYQPDEWEVDKSKLIVGPQIGTGSFGMVYKGQLITEKGLRDCAVKTVPPTSTAKQRFDFLREASIMKQFDTFYVVRLLGVVSVTTPVYVIMEYMENGDLKDFLRRQRDIYKKQNKVLVDGIYLMSAQIADGMAYLASKKFVHRDLAARNCMVGENRIVKIGDFGLTRDIYENDYYRRDTNGRLPVRWMAPESLGDNIYTSASDVWSYGIVLWEIVTFSAYPYQGLSNDEVLKRVVQGYTMPRPDHCPDKLYYIMEKCWKKNDKDRLTFLDIVEYLLPETEGKLYPNCYYRKPKVEGDSIAHTIPDESNTGTESYPLLSWPSSNRANGLTNGDNHTINHNHSSDRREK